MTHVWRAALYAATTGSQEMISVRNLSSAFVAEIGDGSCVTSYPVTVGDTALSTTIDYTSPTVNCSYDVAAQVLCSAPVLPGSVSVSSMLCAADSAAVAVSLMLPSLV